jgi:hypothetical protein
MICERAAGSPVPQSQIAFFGVTNLLYDDPAVCDVFGEPNTFCRLVVAYNTGRPEACRGLTEGAQACAALLRR